jgi:hypothetical protein
MSGVADEVVGAIASHPLCEQIVRFLIEHDSAMDTVRGIARCWVNTDEVAVQSAVERLLSVGVVVSRALSSNTYYGLTSNPSIRARLTTYGSPLPGAQQARCANSDGREDNRCGVDR